LVFFLGSCLLVFSFAFVLDFYLQGFLT
jgi:hypothetical protein